MFSSLHSCIGIVIRYVHFAFGRLDVYTRESLVGNFPEITVIEQPVSFGIVKERQPQNEACKMKTIFLYKTGGLSC